MKPLSDETTWPLFAVFDAEALKWVEIFRVCHWDEFGGKETFDNFEQYLDYLYSSKFESNVVWSHWGGRYDTRFVIKEAVRRRWGWHAAMSGSLIIICTVTNDIGQKIKFCDSGRLLPSSVREIGKTIGLPKLELDRADLGAINPETGKPYYTAAQIEEYCFRDCEIVLKALQQLRAAMIAIGCDFGFTLASVATRRVRRGHTLQWKRFYRREKQDNGEYKLVYSRDMLDADAYCIPAYYGGRTEVFRLGKYTNLFMYDIRSSYPRSMIEPLPAYFKGFDLPLEKLVSFQGRPCVKVQDTQRLLEKCGVSEASIWMPNDPELFKFPVLPWRDDENTKVVYPLLTQGEKSRWTNIELLKLWEQGKEHGVRIEVHNQATFEPVAFLRPYTEQFFELRMQAKARGDKFFDYAMKILLNSMYGKLIESTEKRSVLCGDDVIKAAIEKYGENGIKESPAPGIYFQVAERLCDCVIAAASIRWNHASTRSRRAGLLL
jgi:hypothetical protein